MVLFHKIQIRYCNIFHSFQYLCKYITILSSQRKQVPFVSVDKIIIINNTWKYNI